MLRILIAIGVIFNVANAQETVKNVPFNGDFYSAGNKDKIGILIVAGSGMGKDHETATRLNAMGYNVLAISYYGEEGLPETLEMIPIEYFETARKWLDERSSGVILYGLSKGAEASLVLASHYPDEYKGIIAMAPSKVVWQGFPKDFSKIMQSPSSWSFDGKAIPFVPYISREKQNELGLDNRHAASLTQKDKVKKALIPVQDIDIPTLLLSGGKDKAWPSTAMAWEICEKIGEQCSHISYPNGGHLLEEFKEEYMLEVEEFLKRLP
ncbi:acyl-CoA thioester hydrolase/BAAT C-terminal domain-containing protein [Pseudemcibacter aquimaris]|uniref:acyl-CoA thioester hydrolase/BAAT C-terminal domain-containing protein n=1 Tax=Pseudemcibacter aquimaris TaxID=2857064 RepID=UPI002011EBD2|nr:acyl-CoA thioester hydrolase/BAAT C-terminal domain-containing protein [Pseudemcibacter aquimaris]MCC3860193.1 hypothetical protein [Pseudemcibacter aquimaris]WDU57518.1 hypothetical protein KW060_09960 [Pseudemcibacter aquimaris]